MSAQRQPFIIRSVTVPEIFRRPLKGMGTGLGRLVTRALKLAALSAVTTFVILVLDAMLLSGVRRETAAESNDGETSLDNS